MGTVKIQHPVVHLFGRVVFCVALAVSAPDSRGACRTNISIGDAIQFGDGPLAAPSARFPYVAYTMRSFYSIFYNQTVSDVKTDECTFEPFAAQVSRVYQSARSLVSVSSAGGKPEFRFRARASLGKELAETITTGVSALGIFRFRDVITYTNAGTDPVNVAVTISMNGNVSRPLGGIPEAQQQGHSLVRLRIEDLTFCGTRPLVNVSHTALTEGPDYVATYVITTCPTAVIRVDLLVDLNATAHRFVTIGTQTFLGGYAYADYTQCVTGNNVCYEDCADPDLESCSGFSIRAKVLDPPAGAAAGGPLRAAAAPVGLVSAAGYDYSAPLPVYKPTLRVRQGQGGSIVQWPSGASDWQLAASPDLGQWNTITNQPGFEPEDGLFQMTWPLTNGQQYFRLEKL